MKLDLSTYHSILYNDLRPWLDSNKDDNRFRAKLTPNFKNPTESSIDFDNAINKALIDYKSTLNATATQINAGKYTLAITAVFSLSTIAMGFVLSISKWLPNRHCLNSNSGCLRALCTQLI